MIKNRIRTAALAGAVAVATGVSGLAVPAMAEEANNAPANVVQALQAAALSEDDLYDNLEEITNFLAEERDERSIVRAEFLDRFASKNPTDVLNPSEEAARDAFYQRAAEVEVQLNAAVDNVAEARTSVRAALDADEAAVEAYENLDDFMAALSPVQVEAINALIADVNDENETQLDDLTPLVYPADAQDALSLEREIQQHRLNAGNHQESDNEGAYVSRDYIRALDTLEADSLVSEVLDLAATARIAAEESQRSDVLVRQLLLEHATAQLNALRAVHADYVAVGRWAELYANDAAFEDQANGWETVRARYYALLDTTGTAVSQNLTHLDEAQQAVEEGFTSWDEDLRNDEEEEEYLNDRLAFAQTVYDRMDANNEWQNEFSLVRALDAKFSNEAAAEAEEAAKEAEEAAKEAEEERRAAADRLEEILAGIEEALSNNDAPANEDDQNDDDNNGSSIEGSSNGNLGIFAVLAGVIGLIAAAFPFVSNFLNLNR